MCVGEERGTASKSLLLCDVAPDPARPPVRQIGSFDADLRLAVDLHYLCPL